MSQIYPVLIGVAATAFVMVLSNVSNRRDRDIIELFRRVNQLEKEVSRLDIVFFSTNFNVSRIVYRLCFLGAIDNWAQKQTPQKILETLKLSIKYA